MNRSRVTGDLASHGNIFVDIANDRVGIGSTIPGEKLSLPDSAKIALGNSADLSIYHNGSNSYLVDSGTGALQIQASTFYLKNAAGNENMIQAHQNGAVNLYYDNSKKLETTGYGINITAHSDIRFTNGNWTGDITNAKIQLYNNILYLAGGTEGIMLREGSTDRWRMDPDGNFDPATDALYDIGQSNLRVRRGYFEDLNVSDDITVGDDITFDGELNMMGSSDSAKYFDARTGTSNQLHFRSTSGGDTNHVTILSIGQNGSSFVGDLTLGDGTADSAAGPEFKLNRNSASPANADYLGQIKFAGRSSTGVERNYAKITGKILDVTNGSEDGILEFAHIKAGSQVITGRFRSDSFQLLNGTNLSVNGTSSLQSTVSIDTTLNEKLVLRGSNDPYVRFKQGTTDKAYIQWDATNATFLFVNQASSEQLKIASGINGLVFRAENTNYNVWHQGNDGSGSTLDADLLDGIDSSQFLRSDANDTTTGNLTLASSTDEKIALQGSNSPYIRFKEGTTNKAYIQWNPNGSLYIVNDETSEHLRIASGSTGLIFYDGSDRTVWTSGNDGVGSGLDADTLDGQHGSYYRNATNLNAGTVDDARLPGTISSNITGNAASLKIVDTRNDGTRYPNDYTNHAVTAEFTNQIINGWHTALTVKGWADGYAPWQLVGYSDTGQNTNLRVRFGHGQNNTWSSLYNIWHTGNDGSGSGLDADTLDGVQGASFLRSDAEDTMTAPLVINAGTANAANDATLYITASNNNDWGIKLNNYNSSATEYGARIEVGSSANYALQITGNGSEVFRVTGSGTVYAGGGNTVWHAGNDGSGSGLDADTLDGIQSGNFLRSDTNDTINGILTVGGSSVSANEGGEIRLTHAPNGSLSGSNVVIDMNGNNFRIFEDGGNTRGYYISISAANNSASTKIWHENNDGSGSGLDADLWDGNQFSTYLNQALLTGSSPSFTRVNVTGSHGINNDGWFRNTTSGEGLYNNATTQHFYSDDDDYWNVAGGGGANGIRFRDDHNGTIRGYVYVNSSSQIGFLNQSGNWTLRTTTAGITKLGSKGYQLIDGNVNNNLYLITGTTGASGLSAFNSNNQWRWQIYGDGSNYGFLDANWGSWDIQKTVNGQFRVDEGNGLVRPWNSNIDGSGSGLDADLLDGVQGSSYLRSDTNDVLGGVLSYHSNDARLQFRNTSYNTYLYIGGWSSTNSNGISRIRNSSDNLHIDCGAQGSLYLNNYSSKITYAADIRPKANNTYDLGGSSNRWRDLYINDLALSNESKKDTGGNDVDGTWGDWRIQEGESDLFIINNRNGKKYKFNLTEVS